MTCMPAAVPRERRTSSARTPVTGNTTSLCRQTVFSDQRASLCRLRFPNAARSEAKGGLRKLFSLSEAMPNIVHILEACRADFVDKNPDLAKAYVRDITRGMEKALANREETLKVVSEVLKAPVPVLDTYLLKGNDFGRDPGAAPNFDAIQKMFDIYTDAGMLPKMDVAQFKGPITAPIR